MARSFSTVHDVTKVADHVYRYVGVGVDQQIVKLLMLLKLTGSRFKVCFDSKPVLGVIVALTDFP